MARFLFNFLKNQTLPISFLFSAFFASAVPAAEPVITSMAPPADAVVGTLYSHQIVANDPEGGTLTYSLPEAPASMMIDSSGLISWTPVLAEAGMNTVKVKVLDNEGLSDIQKTQVYLPDPGNSTPVFGQEPVTDATVDQLYSYDLQATDADGHTLSYSIVKPVSIAGMQISSTGVFTWTPAQTDAGKHCVDLQVDDGHNGFAFKTYDLSVFDPNNQLPVIGQEPATQSNYGELYTYDLQASDPDGDPLIYRIRRWPVVEGLQIGSDGIVSWTPTRDEVGEYWIHVKADDGHLGTVTKDYMLTIIDPLNQAPVIGQEPTTQTHYGELYTYDLQASDADGDALTYKIKSWPIEPDLQISNEGIVTWTPSRDDVGDIEITVTVDDGHLGTVSKKYDLTTIDPNNNPPVIGQEPITETDYGELYTYDLQATDPDADPLTYSISWPHLPGLVISNTGVLSWTPTHEDVGSRWITVKVNDDYLGEVTKKFKLWIRDPLNQAPVFTSTPVTQTTVGVVFPYNAVAIDGNGDTVSYHLVNGPTGLTVDSVTGQVTWTPTVEAPAPGVWIKIEAKDNYGGLTRQDFQVVVQSSGSNTPPSINSSPVTTAEENTQYQYQIDASDADNDLLTYSLTVAPAGMTIDSNGLLSWLPEFETAGTHTVTAVIQDTHSAIVEQSFTLTVANTNRAPVLGALIDISVLENTTHTVTLNALDADNDTLTYSVSGLPAFASLVDTQISFAPDYGTAGSYGPITAIVSDGTDSHTLSFNVDVTFNNRAPNITSTPVAFVVEGNTWTYMVEATDSDGDNLTVSMPQSPAGATLDTNTQTVSWSSASVAPGSVDFQLRVQDSNGAIDEQSINLAVLSATRQTTHEGREFWLPVISNFTVTGSTYHIYLLSTGQDATATIDIPVLGISESIPLLADQISTYSIPGEDFLAVGGYDRHKVLVDHAIHISAGSNITAYVLNQKDVTTDGYLGLPADALGKQYVVGHYTAIQNGFYYDDMTRFGRARLPFTGIVATEDNTQINIIASMDLFLGTDSNNDGHVKKGESHTLTLNAGDVYNLEARGSDLADLTGTLINADKPISVLGAHYCAFIPAQYPACDHLVEQLPPVESLGTEYFTAPLFGRGGNASAGLYGDAFRIIAPFDNTDITINGVLRRRLKAQEFYEFHAPVAQHIQATQPVMVMQYSTGQNFDDSDPNTEIVGADPFMIVVPPAQQYLTAYTVNTPLRNIDRNFLNILIPTDALATATIDGVAIDTQQFAPIDTSGYSYGQIEVATGSHRVQAQAPLGVYVYGFDTFESYGYLGGMAFSLPDVVSQLTLETAQSLPLGEQRCATASVFDTNNLPVIGVRVAFSVIGTRLIAGYVLSDAYGKAQYCYDGLQQGDDTLTATVGSHSDTQTLTWLPPVTNAAPVITSVPTLLVNNGDNYSYQLMAVDPNNNVLSYALTSGAPDMVLSDSGLLQWASATVDDQLVTITVQDGLGGVAEQHFLLSENKAFNTVPSFTTTTPGTIAVVGVPYAYDSAWLGQNLSIYKTYINTEDADGDGVRVSLVNGPQGAVIDLQNLSDDPFCLVGCIHRIDWIPTQAGSYPIELALSDFRGGVADSQQFTVQVADNQPPVFNSFQPSTQATVGHQYVYVLDISNDVPIYGVENPDNVRVTFDQAPTGMTSALRYVSGEEQTLYISWTPSSGDVGSHTIELRVDDQVNSTATQSFTIQVVDDNQVPAISSAADTVSEVSIPYVYQLVATDADADPLSYRLLAGPAGMSISNTGLVSWTPTAEEEGRYYRIWLAVDDGRGGITTQDYYSRVNAFSNRAPTFNPAYHPATAKVGVEYVHQVQATDREGDALTYSSYHRNPADVTVDQQGVLRWTPAETGTYNLFGVRVTDSAGAIVDETWQLTVLDNTAALDAELHLTPTNIIDLNESVTATVWPENEASSVQVTLTVDGQSVAVDSLLQAQLTPTRVGKIPVSAVITDGIQSITRNTTVFVRDPNDTTAPVVEIHSPENVSDVTAPIMIVGTAQDENLVEVLVAYKRADQTVDQYIELYRGASEFIQQNIASFDPTMLVNGSYHILLQATDSNNNFTGRQVSVLVDGDLKVGNFSFTVEDINLPLAGIPITVSRTYDSRRRTENLDFGYGWSIDYQNVHLEESDEPTKGWSQITSDNELFQSSSGLFNSNATCAYSVHGKRVSVTLPNGDIEKFNVRVKPGDGSLVAISNPDCFLVGDRHYDLEFVGVGDTTSTLTTPDGNSLYLSDLDNGYLSYPGDGQALNITNYVLTTRTGFIYTLNQDFGVEKIEDPNGNTVTYSDIGIVHSSGQSITFNRDVNGRINSLTDPSGRQVVYSYNLLGDLTSVTDRTLAQSTYAYNSNHGLLDMFDALGRRLLKNIYDEDGRLIAQEDGEGNRTDFNHDIAGRLSVITNRRGYTTQYGYDDHGNVTTQVDALGNTTTYMFDANDNQLSETNALGHTSTATFNDSNDQLTQTDALGNTTTFTYNGRGQELTITDALNQVFTTSYDSSGNLLSVQDPDGNTASNIVNSIGRITQTTDVLGHQTNYTYDVEDIKQTETDALGNTTSFTYDDRNNVLTEARTRTTNSVAVTETTTFEYDDSGRVTATIDALGQRSETEYNLAGQIMATVDALGRRTEMDYDAYERLIQTRYPDGTQEDKTYDEEGNLATETDRAGRVTTFEYDALNRLTKTTTADGSSTQTEYDAMGRVAAQIDANNNRTEFEYDAVGRRTLTRDAQGNEHRFEYDANGNLTAEVDALNQRTEYEYNALDQKVKTTFHNASTMLDTMDALSRRLSQTDQAGISTTYAYDALGRLSSVTDMQGGITNFTYDEAGNKLTQTDAQNRTTSWTYDALGRITTRTLPLGQAESFVYDAVGNMTDHTDFNGQITTYTYDANNNRLTRIDYADGRVEGFTYSAMGNRISATATVNSVVDTTTYAYDNRDRLTLETRSDNSTLAYVYDSAGNKTKLTITRGTSSTVTDFAYDTLNRLSSVTDINGITSYGYDSVGNRSSVSYPNGVSATYSYDTLNRLITVQHHDGLGALLEQFDYSLHATGRRTQIDEADGRSTEYTYDTLYRLIGEAITDAVNGNYNATYQYDAVGNRTYETVNGAQTAYIYDDNDRLTQQGGTSYTYDNQGNTLTETLDGNVTSYTYDAKYTLQSGTKDAVTTTYRYNVNGIRTGKTQGTTSTDYLVDENRDYTQVLDEVVNGVTEVAYNYGDDLISQDRSGGVSYYQYDGLGSVRSLSDLNGTTTDSYDYEAFGETLNQTGSTVNSYLFAGEQFDTETDHYYLRNRYYNTDGRFLTQDTWMGRNSNPITLNKYLYANADPVNHIDPTGNFSIGSSMAGLGVAAILTTAAVSTTNFSSLLDTSIDAPFSPSALGLLVIMGSNPTLGSKLAGLLGAKTDTATSTSGAVVPLYRAVESAEYTSIIACRCFSFPDFGFGVEPTSVKRFFLDAGSAVTFGKRFFQNTVAFHVIEATVSERFFTSLPPNPPGDAFIGPGIAVPHGLIPAVNAEVMRHGGIVYLGSY